jgi:hypothetical protein
VSTGALARVIRTAAETPREAVERCDVCSEAVPDDHRHLFDTERREVLCACRPCSVLFVADAAAEGHYRLVPTRRLRLPPVSTEPLGIPVGLAFFVSHADGAVTAHYPSPAGAGQWEVETTGWEQVCAACPPAATLQPEVEALLVHTVRERSEHWIVPVDDCFRLIALVRREWRGLSGGSRIWPEVDRFFAQLTERRE